MSFGMWRADLGSDGGLPGRAVGMGSCRWEVYALQDFDQGCYRAVECSHFCHIQ